MKARYRRLCVKGKEILLHRYLWELASGPIPKNHDIAHIDGNPKNNRPNNLACWSRQKHMRMDKGNYKILPDGSWIKRCRECRKWKPLNDFYSLPRPKSKVGISHDFECKPCHIKRSRANYYAKKGVKKHVG